MRAGFSLVACSDGYQRRRPRSCALLTQAPLGLGTNTDRDGSDLGGLQLDLDGAEFGYPLHHCIFG